MEEHRLRMSENRVLRRIFGPRRKEVAGGWRRLHNEELHHASQNIIRSIKLRIMRCAGHVARMKDEKCIQHFGRPGYRWEDNIRMDLWAVVWKVVDWIHLARDRNQWRAVVNTVMNLRVP
jgi:hypothetical protein